MTEPRDAAADLAVCEACPPGPWWWMDGSDSDSQEGRQLLMHSCDFPGSIHEGFGHSHDECGFVVLEAYCPAEEGTEEFRADNRPSQETADFLAMARDALPHWIARAQAAEQRLAAVEAELERQANLYQRRDGEPGPLSSTWGWRTIAETFRQAAAKAKGDPTP